MANKRKSFLPFSPPFIGEEEINEVVDTLKSGWMTTGPKTGRFEKDFTNFIGSSASLALSSCTAGLQIALRSLGVGEGDYVISTPMTFGSGIMAIEDIGAKPILADIDPKTLNIDPDQVASILKNHPEAKKIKAMIVVHFGGYPCDMDRILEMAKQYQLKVIEDAAHAIPAKYKGKMIGTIGEMTVFSFYVTKNMTTAEGGMLTGSKELIERARILSLHGISQDAYQRYQKEGSWFYEIVDHGFKANMTDIQASLGIHQLKRLPEFHKRRKEIARQYDKAFKTESGLQVPVDSQDIEHAWHLYTLRLSLEKIKISRSTFIEELKARNIGASVHFIPVHMHPYFKDKYDLKPESFPVACKEYERIVSLPIYPAMTGQDVSDVTDAVLDIIERNRGDRP